jgi:DNA-directed RNA polymerase subunit M/transcription elongation factor TFIIS
MKFCDNCGKILELKNEGEKVIGSCSCGFSIEIKDLIFSEKAEPKKKIGKGALTGYETKGFPHECEKCGFGFCDITEYGPFFTDESPVYLYKCKRCGHTERQADGSSNN